MTRTRLVTVAILPLAAGLGLATAAASAGTYDVLACDAAETLGGDVQSLVLYENSSFESLVHCPTDNSYPDGIISHNRKIEGNKALWGRGAGATFTAPAGNYVREVQWRGVMSRTACDWATGIAANGQFVYGLAANNNCAQVGLDEDRWVAINAGSFSVGVACGNVSGCSTAPVSWGWHDHAVSIRTHSLRVRVEDTTAPSVTNLGGPLAAGAWVRGTQSVTYDATDAAGIFLTRLRVATVERENTLRPCDYRYATPCQPVSNSYSFNTTALSDGEHQLAVEAIDPAGNLGAGAVTLRTDNTPPARAAVLAVEGGDGWRGSNSFAVSWQNPGGQFAPIVGAHYAICPGPELDANCTRGSSRGDAITRLSGLQVPGPGDWLLRVWLEDAAGNVDEKTASDPAHLRFDDRPPEIAFSPQDPNDPRRVSATVSDPASGPAGGTIELGRDGSGSWRALPTTLEAGQLVAYVDDERLRDGRYLLRAQASDAAGNQGVGDRRTDGSVAELFLPLRSVTTLRLGVPKRVRVRKVTGKGRRWVHRLDRRRRVRYGRSVLLKGRLESWNGQPLVGQRVTVYGRPLVRGARLQPLGTVTTNGRGRFRYRARALFSMRLRASYPGTALIRPAVTRATLVVRARATLRVSERVIRRGQRVVFSGRFKAPKPLRSGKVVEVQAKVRGGWRPIAPAVRTDKRGRYMVAYRFQSTTRTLTYTFRTRIARQRGYPYIAGSSRRARVTVRVG